MRHDADILAFSLQNRPLLDVQLKESMHLAVADLLFALPANPLQLITKAFAIRIHAVIRPIERMLTCKHTRREHRGRIARAFFIGPVGYNNRMLGFDIQIIQRA